MAKKKEGTKGIGRWAAIGMTPATSAWKNANPADEHLIFLLDSASGEITVCGDTSGARSGLAGGGAAASIVTPARRRRKPVAKKA